MKRLLLALFAVTVVAPRAEALDDLLPVVRTFSFSCTTTAAAVVPTTGRNSIKSMRLVNKSSTPVYLGGSDVNTSTTGYPICTNQMVCESVSFVVEAQTVVWCKAASTVVIQVAPPGEWSKPDTRVVLPSDSLEFLTDMDDASVSGVTVSDYSVENNDGTLQNGAASVSGSILQARQFVAASNRFMDMSTVPGGPIQVASDDFTLFCHLKSPSGFSVAMSNRSGGNLGWYMAMTDSGLYSYLRTASATTEGYLCSGDLADDTYHDIGVTFVRGSGGSALMTGYVDGVVCPTTISIAANGTEDPNTGTYTLFGRVNSGFASAVTIDLDEPAIWREALEASDFAWLHQLRMAGISIRSDMGL